MSEPGEPAGIEASVNALHRQERAERDTTIAEEVEQTERIAEALGAGEEDDA